MPRRYSMGRRGGATERTRTRLRMALVRLLEGKPYGAITMADIAAEADVSVRTVQRHYPSKDDLLGACARSAAQAISQGLTAAPPAQSAEEAVRRLVETLFAVYDRHSAECRAVYSRAPDVQVVRGATDMALEARVAHVEALMARWPQAWAAPVEEAKGAMVALTEYLAWVAFTGAARFAPPQAARIAADMLCRGLLREYEANGP